MYPWSSVPCISFDTSFSVEIAVSDVVVAVSDVVDVDADVDADADAGADAGADADAVSATAMSSFTRFKSPASTAAANSLNGLRKVSVSVCCIA